MGYGASERELQELERRLTARPSLPARVAALLVVPVVLGLWGWLCGAI